MLARCRGSQPASSRDQARRRSAAVSPIDLAGQCRNRYNSRKPGHSPRGRSSRKIAPSRFLFHSLCVGGLGCARAVRPHSVWRKPGQGDASASATPALLVYRGSQQLRTSAGSLAMPNARRDRRGKRAAFVTMHATLLLAFALVVVGASPSARSGGKPCKGCDDWCTADCPPTCTGKANTAPIWSEARPPHVAVH